MGHRGVRKEIRLYLSDHLMMTYNNNDDIANKRSPVFNQNLFTLKRKLSRQVCFYFHSHRQIKFLTLFTFVHQNCKNYNDIIAVIDLNHYVNCDRIALGLTYQRKPLSALRTTSWLTPDQLQLFYIVIDWLL